MKEPVGTRGLILNEPLLWERGGKGRTGYSLPRRDVASAPLPDDLMADVLKEARARMRGA